MSNVRASYKHKTTNPLEKGSDVIEPLLSSYQIGPRGLAGIATSFTLIKKKTKKKTTWELAINQDSGSAATLIVVYVLTIQQGFIVSSFISRLCRDPSRPTGGKLFT